MKRDKKFYNTNNNPYNLKNEIGVAGFLAWKNLIFHKKTLLLVALIIGLGFLSATFSAAVITGLRVMIEDKAINTMTGNILLVPKDKHDYIPNVEEVEKKLLSIPGIVAVSPHFTTEAVLIDKEGNKVGVQLRIVDPEKEADTTYVDDWLVAGKYLSKGTVDGTYIGGALTKKYAITKSLPTIDVDVGDRVSLVSNAGIADKLKIEGIYTKKFIAGEIFVYITKEEAKRYFNLSEDQINNYVNEILVKTARKGDEEKIISQINQLNINAKAYSWEERLGTIGQFTDSLMIISKITMIIGALISFGTIYIMILINVLQKRAQIGILKAIGISETTITLSYLLQSIAYGFSGVLTGIAITGILIYYFTLHPLHMPIGLVTPIININFYYILSIIFLITSVFAGYFASKGVIKENILDSIFKG